MSEGSPPTDGPCTPWADSDSLLTCAACDAEQIAEHSDDQIDEALVAASWMLWAATGRQYDGGCEIVLRPCCGGDISGADRWPFSRWASRWDWPAGNPRWYPTLVEGSWYNVSGCGSPCVAFECGRQIPRIDLGRVIQSIDEIVIDGETLDVDAYRLDAYRYATRIDGDRWPVTQNLIANDGDDGTWSITVTAGLEPPTMGRRAAAELAWELIQLCCNDGAACRLPQRVVQAQRSGVTYNMTDIMDVVNAGATGLYAVDSFIKHANPNGLMQAPRVRSPELDAARSGTHVL